MGSKNFHRLYDFESEKPMFFEARFLMQNPPPEEKKPQAAEEPEKKQEEKNAEGKRADVKKTGKKGREAEKAMRKSRKDLDDLKETVVKIPNEPKLPIEKFNEKNFREVETQLDAWSLNVKRETYQINWQNWDHTTPDGVNKIYQECKDLGIINQDSDFYDTMFPILRDSADRGKNRNLADTDIRNAFLKPTDDSNRAKIAALAPSGDFAGGEAFLKAFDHLQFLKARIHVQYNFQKAALEKQRKAGEDPVAGKVTDFVRSNVATFQKAIRDRDYATAGVYALGIYALYQTVGKKIFGGDKGHGGGDGSKGFDFKKWLLIGAAAYCGNKFAKNAGYDILKMTGFKTSDAEVEGTPMAVLSNILHQSEFSEDTKDLDFGVVLTMSETKLATLEELRQQSNKKGIGFIHPREFPALFPDIKNAWPFKMGLGEEGLKDYIGMSNTKLSPKEREYIRVGQQIYKLALAMQATYDETLHQHHKKYLGKTYQEALKDPDLKNSKVRHLMESVHDYANERVAGGLFSGKKMQEIEGLLNEGLEKAGLKDEAFSLENEIQEGTRHYRAYVHGFPVVVVAASTGYRVYLRGDYGKSYNAAPGPGIAEIPLQGSGGKAAMTKIVQTIEAKMKELIDKSPLVGDKGQLKNTLHYAGGQWQVEVDDPEISDLDIDAGKSVVVVSPDEDGMSINGKSLDRGERFPREILPKLLGQNNFHALRIFMSAGALDAKYDPSKPGQFTLIIGKKKQIETKIVYNTKTKRFSFFGDTTEEKKLEEEKLFKSGSGFAEELAGALGEDGRMNKQLEEWKKMINNTDESYLINFLKSVPDWFTGATWSNIVRGFDLNQLTGSVAKNYTIGLLEGQKALIVYRMSGASLGAKSLNDISKNYDQIFVPGVNALDYLRAKFSDMNTQNEQAGKDWEKDDFNTTIFGEIAKIGINSDDYQGWYAKFVNEIFYKYGFDDLRKGNALKARDVVKVFTYYTAVVDDKDLDGADLGLTVSKEGLEYIKAIKQAKEKLVKGGKPDLTDKDVAIEANVLLSTAGLTALPLLIDSDVPKFLDLEAKLEKQAKHKQAAGYAEYVAGKIYEKYNNGDLGKQVNIPIPENQAFWGIEKFDNWKVNHPADSHEFIDTNETLKMNRQYVTINEYFDLSPAARSKYRKEDIILPRDVPEEGIDFVIRMKADGSEPIQADQEKAELLEMLLVNKSNESGVITGEKFEYTDAEIKFREKIRQVLKKIESKYGTDGENLLTGRFLELKEMFNYSARYTYTESRDTNGEPVVIYHYNFDRTELKDVNGSIVRKVDKELLGEMKRMDAKFDSNSPETITRGNQEAYINHGVENFVKEQVLSDAGKSRYFKQEDGLLTKVGEAIKQMGKDIKDWIF